MNTIVQWSSRLALVVAGLVVAGSTAAPVQQWFDKGNRLYEQQQYDSAVVYYEKILNAGIDNADVQFNLGNALFRLHRLGPAVLHYEKARQLNPSDRDIANNLKFANLAIVDRPPDPEKTFAEQTVEKVHNLLSLRTQLWVGFALLLICSVCFSLSLFVSHNARLWLIYLLSLSTLLLFVTALSAGTKVYRSEKYEYAIVMKTTVDAVNEPKGSKILFTVHEGTRFQIRQRLDSWVLVSLPNGISGWVRSEVLGLI